MAMLKDSILILGEGPTEVFYLLSLKDAYPQLQNIVPKLPSNTSINDLDKRIQQGIDEGYSKIFCLIDMDNKKEGTCKQQYQALKQRYARIIAKPKQGIYCEVRFFETHRCIEQFFLFYFDYRIKEYKDSDAVKNELHKVCGYENTIKFFRQHPLHPYFEAQGGKIENAINNANKSLKTMAAEGRDYTYSQMGQFISIITSFEEM